LTLHLAAEISARNGENENVAKKADMVVKDPEILGGTPVFRGTRVPFQNLIDYLEGGETLDEFLDDFPTVTREAAIAALDQAKALLVEKLG
jgi:uncharacterized protein (DUF433 family)